MIVDRFVFLTFTQIMNDVEWNFEIQDKEMPCNYLALEEWCHFLGICNKTKFGLDDHKNLTILSCCKSSNCNRHKWCLVILSSIRFCCTHCPQFHNGSNVMRCRNGLTMVHGIDDNFNLPFCALSSLHSCPSGGRHRSGSWIIHCLQLQQGILLWCDWGCSWPRP